MTENLEEYRNKIKICAIVGPTASGKSSLAIWLAKHINAEIVSADSMQIYKGMNIGTAKPSVEERKLVSHHMIDFLNQDELFSVADYVKMAKSVIENIVDRGKKPILVGGTGLYVDSLLNDIKFQDQDENFVVRKKLFEELDKFGSEYVLEKLKKIDFEYAKTLHPNNIKRIIRGLEIYYSTGIKMSDNLKLSKSKTSCFDACMIGLTFENRENLYKRINDRVDNMMDCGLLKEAENIINSRAISNTSMQAIGYKEFIGYFNGIEDLDECVLKLKQNTRKYAKRQLTWFRRNRNINWIYCDKLSDVEVKNIIIRIVENHFK